MAQRTWAALVAFLLLWAGAPAGADEPAPGGDEPAIVIAAEVDVTAAGDAKAVIRLSYKGGLYATVKEKFPDPRKFLQDIRSNRADYETAPDMKADYDDASSSVVLRLTELGAAKNQGEGVWAMTLEAGYELVKSSPEDAPRPVATFHEKATYDGGATSSGTYVYSIPAGATEANWDKDAHVLSWKLPYAGGRAPGKLSASFRSKDRLMSTIYKLYGLGADFGAQWVAKTVLKNTGTNVVRNVRVRYRIERYTEWSPWDKFPEVVPGQTVVSAYYPVIDAAIAKIHSNTPANVLLEWSYEDAEGKKREDDDAKKVVLLGVNEYVFSNLAAAESFGSWHEASNNAPLLAAWVFRNDPVIKEFASMANKNAAGAGASTDDATAIEVLRACYEILRANDFTYQHPPALDDKTVSFDVQRVQNVKFPRDTIRDKSGTCIDLAILYASLANAVGLEPHLALVPGHCFPVVRLPSGALVAVETTGVAGGLRFNSAPFDRVLEHGNKELADANADGRIHLIDVRGLWTRGVSNPELDDLPADILQKWGISAAGRGTPQAEPPVAREGGAQGAQRSGNDLVGLWSGPLSEKQDDGSVLSYSWSLGIDHADDGKYRATARAEVKVPSPQGDIPVVLVQYFGGEIRDGMLVLVGEKKTLTNAETGASKEMSPPDTVKIQFDGDDIVGKLGGDAAGWQDFRMKRQAAGAAAAQTDKELLRVWEGTIETKLPDGRSVTAPIRIGVDAADGGRFSAGMRVEATVDGQHVVIVELLDGEKGEGGSYIFKAHKVTITNTKTGKEQSGSPDTIVCRIENGRLVGKVGNDAEGWNDFSLAPQKK